MKGTNYQSGPPWRLSLLHNPQTCHTVPRSGALVKSPTTKFKVQSRCRDLFSPRLFQVALTDPSGSTVFLRRHGLELVSSGKPGSSTAPGCSYFSLTRGKGRPACPCTRWPSLEKCAFQ